MDNNVDGGVEVPVEPVTETATVETKEKGRKVNVLAIILGITTLVFAGLAVYFGIEFFKPKGSGTSQGNGSGTVVDGGSSDKDGGNKDTTSGVTSMRDDYRSVEKIVREAVSGVQNKYYNLVGGSGLVYKPAGLNTYVPMRADVEVSIHFGVDEGGEESMAIIKSKLEELGFEAVGNLPFLGSAGPEIYGYNDSNNTRCEVFKESNYQSLNPLVGYEEVTLKCGKTGWDFLLDDELSLVGELETAYYNEVGEYPRIIDIRKVPEVENSQYEPYQVLQVSLGGGVGLFYRVSPNDKWQFFRVVQDAPECSEYDTDDLKKAFAGKVCYNGSEESTVQP